MNADQAKELHLPTIIEAAGGRRDEHKGARDDEAWFFSPFRDERTASLKAARGKNGRWMWTDYGSGQGGNVIAFANVVLGRAPDDRAISDALKWLRGLAAYQTTERARPGTATTRSSGGREGRGERSARPDRFTIESRKRVHHPSTLKYIDSRGVSRAAALAHLEEVTFRDNERKRTLYGLGMQNDAGGVEITTATATPFKTCIGPKACTSIKGAVQGLRLDVFEGMFDFLSFLALMGAERPPHDVMILHSAALVERAVDRVREGGRRVVVTWLDNDEAGERAAERILEAATAEGHEAGTMNHLWAGYKDLNDWQRETRPAPITSDPAGKQFYDTAWTSVMRSRARLDGPG